jgi:hypothetical protein
MGAMLRVPCACCGWRGRRGSRRSRPLSHSHGALPRNVLRAAAGSGIGGTCPARTPPTRRLAKSRRGAATLPRPRAPEWSLASPPGRPCTASPLLMPELLAAEPLRCADSVEFTQTSAPSGPESIASPLTLRAGAAQHVATPRMLCSRPSLVAAGAHAEAWPEAALSQPPSHDAAAWLPVHADSAPAAVTS